MSIQRLSLLLVLFGLCGCFPQAKKTPHSLRKRIVTFTEDQKSFMKAIEEKSVRLAAFEHNITCQNVEALQAKEGAPLGMPELLGFIVEECSGKEPLLPQRMPAKCKEQMEIPQDSLGSVPGLEVRAEDVRKHNMSQCFCSPEYKLVEDGQSPVCQLNLALSQ